MSTTSDRIAVAMAVVLIAFAVTAELWTAWVVVTSAPRLSNPATAYAWSITAWVLAVGLSALAVRRLRRVWHEEAEGWPAAFAFYAAAVIAQFGLLFLAVLIALGSSD